MSRICLSCNNELKSTQYKYCSKTCQYKNVIPHKGDFWDNVNKTDLCWLWTGKTFSNRGQGFFRKTQGETIAYRISFVLVHGRPIKKGMYICHRCDNPSCVRPEHLFEGTPYDNTHDAISKGRMKISNLFKKH